MSDPKPDPKPEPGEFKRYEAGEPAAHPVKFDGPHAFVDPRAVPEDSTDGAPLPVVAALAPTAPVPPACQDVAAIALEKLAPHDRDAIAQIDPATLLLLARLVAAVVTNCTADEAQANLRRIRRRPAGVTAIMVRATVSALIPATYTAAQKHAITGALLATGLELLDRPEDIARVYADR